MNSPSDAAPISGPLQATDDSDDAKDTTYHPPKRSNALEDQAPKVIFGSSGEEVSSETELGREVVSL